MSPKILYQSRIARLQRALKYCRDTIPMEDLSFAQFFVAPYDSLQRFFHLTLLLGRDILKRASNESGVFTVDRSEHPVPSP